MDRDDLVFATCSQLSGYIKEDTENMLLDENMRKGLDFLSKVEEPDAIIDNLMLNVILLKASIKSLKDVLTHADAWTSAMADMVKKELVSRINNYERRITKLTSPLLDLGSLSVQA